MNDHGDRAMDRERRRAAVHSEETGVTVATGPIT
jgi:hypothetical protein